MAARQLPVAVALGAVSAAVALAFGRVFAGSDWIVPLVLAALLPHAIGALARWRHWSKGVSLAASGVALVAFVVWVLAGDTTTYGLPGLSTLEAIVDRVQDGWELLRHDSVPIRASDGTVLLASLVVWVCAQVADELAFRRHASLGALAPGVMVLTWVTALGTDDGRAVTAIGFGAAATLFLVFQHQALLERRRTRLGPSRVLDAPTLIALGLVFGVAAIGVGVAAAPALPGGDEPLFESGGLGSAAARSYRTTVAPLVDISDKLRRGTQDDLFTVQADEPEYWRITALDQYRGVGGGQWTLTAEGDNAVAEGLDARVPGDALTQRFEIGPLGERWMPAAYRPVAIDRDDTLVVRASSVLVTDRPSVSGLRYTVRSALGPTELTDVQRAAARGPVPPALRVYTQLPADFPAEIEQQAALVAGNIENPYDRARALRDFFREGSFTYDPSVELGDDRAALVTFLQQRRGFCVQFASAYAAMARTLDIPARVAVGFTSGEVDETTGRYRVTNYDAHAWPEIWLNGVGWTNMFDPTPPSALPGGSALPNESPPATEPNPTPAPPVTAPPADTSSPGATTPAPSPGTPDPLTVDPSGPDETGAGWSIGTWLAVVGSIVLGLGLTTAAAVMVAKSRRRQHRRASPSPRAAIVGAWEETLDRLLERGVVSAPSETPLELADRAPDLTGPDVASPVGALAHAYTATRYGDAPVTVARADEAWHDVDELRRALARSAGIGQRVRAGIDLAPLRRPAAPRASAP